MLGALQFIDIQQNGSLLLVKLKDWFAAVILVTTLHSAFLFTSSQILHSQCSRFARFDSGVVFHLVSCPFPRHTPPLLFSGSLHLSLDVRLHIPVDSLVGCHAGGLGLIPGRVGDFIQPSTGCRVAFIIIYMLVAHVASDLHQAGRTRPRLGSNGRKYHTKSSSLIRWCIRYTFNNQYKLLFSPPISRTAPFVA